MASGASVSAASNRPICRSAMLHPGVEALLARSRKRPAFATLTADAVRKAQAGMRAALGSGPLVAAVTDHHVTTRTGRIRARLFEQAGSTPDLIVYLHGGGWVLGEIDDFDPLARVLAVESGCRVLVPGYRLGPEHRFPAALEDTVDTVEWARSALLRQNGPDQKIFLVGDSAEANLACAAARRLRRRGFDKLALFYPVADADMTRPSYAAHGEGYLLRAADMAWFFDQYAPGALPCDQEVALLTDRDFSGLPPTLLTTVEFDVLADEGREGGRREASLPICSSAPELPLQPCLRVIRRHHRRGMRSLPASHD